MKRLLGWTVVVSVLMLTPGLLEAQSSSGCGAWVWWEKHTVPTGNGMGVTYWSIIEAHPDHASCTRAISDAKARWQKAGIKDDVFVTQLCLPSTVDPRPR